MIKNVTQKNLLSCVLSIFIPFIIYSFFKLSGMDFGLLYPTTTALLIGIFCFHKLKTINQLLNNMFNENREIQKYNEIKDVMLQISNSIVHIKNMNELLQLFVNSTVQILDKADTASVLIKNDEGLFEFKAAVGFDLSKVSKIKLSIDETFLNRSDYRKSTIIENPSLFNHKTMTKSHYNLLKDAYTSNITSTICTPIIIDEELYGIINVNSLNKEHIFNEEDVVVMEYLIGQLAVAIKNVLLFEKTLFLSRYDGLTKVYHRHYFDELFSNIYHRAQRYNEQFCLCIVDLNNLKHMNDLYGHLAGDMAIKHFANILKKNIRTSDILGRFGGDEFILIFLNATDEQVKNKMESISNIINHTPLTFDEHDFYVQFSYGIAAYPKDTHNKKELLKIADTRMYQNKARKKNM
ncbi:sensor domain-containing diguanylate cyclase [Crassaminicella indica]|uniref:Sensor domain-containing diguanylate cyclase n=1 Tax=Crassaminicella indica TaxID=2855394 RepID=A0ABX8RCG7_9CLOT|nr:sensor domain-containing diguanylate cyclase [Crassaminicella indica]QXM06491.1 sensor domain-containing diguanylate cyclase [Crassaminicella indica]